MHVDLVIAFRDITRATTQTAFGISSLPGYTVFA
jgi:hypothetical protein